MDDALALLDLGTAAVAMLDPAGLTREELAQGALGLQHHLDRVKTLHAVILNEADRQQIWKNTGARNITDWLAGRTNTNYGDAASRVRLGEALKASKKLKDAVDQGDLTADAAEKLHEAVTNPPQGADAADTEQLIDGCKGASPRDAKKAADSWRDGHKSETEEQAAERRHQQRSVRSTVPIDGMVTTTITLPELEHRIVHNAITHLAGKPSQHDQRTTPQRLADGLVMLCDAYAKGQVVGGREKPTILITINLDSFTGRTDEPGYTAHGDRIPAHVVRHLAEQANLQRVLIAGSQILDLGREVRYATDAQYKALLARDGGCRAPGCTIPAPWCDADHLTPWEEGGETDLSNLALWCRHHHNLKHSPGVQVIGGPEHPDGLHLRLANGDLIHCPPNRPRSTAAARRACPSDGLFETEVA